MCLSTPAEPTRQIIAKRNKTEQTAHVALVYYCYYFHRVRVLSNYILWRAPQSRALSNGIICSAHIENFTIERNKIYRNAHTHTHTWASRLLAWPLVDRLPTIRFVLAFPFRRLHLECRLHGLRFDRVFSSFLLFYEHNRLHVVPLWSWTASYTRGAILHFPTILLLPISSARPTRLSATMMMLYALGECRYLDACVLVNV